MGDIIDDAQEAAELYRENALRASKSLSAIPSSIIDCVECGDRIGTKRKKYIPSAIRCIICQEKFEKRNKKR